MRLTPRIHDRDAAGLTYVYPVVSRRARGVSVGINLNPNNACNWRCVYCQVPGLVAGKGPPIDLELLRSELSAMLEALVRGDYMQRHVPPESRRINDIAFSGNGEPTGSPDFPAAVEVAGEVLEAVGLAGAIRTILITNGSLVHLENVRDGIQRMERLSGEVWFKLDSATSEGQERMNSVVTGPERSLRNLITVAELCPTWVQTMWLARDGDGPSEAEQEAYLALLEEARNATRGLRGVLLYGLARTSHQPEAPELSALPVEVLESWATRIRALGIEVTVSP